VSGARASDTRSGVATRRSGKMTPCHEAVTSLLSFAGWRPPQQGGESFTSYLIRV
jgi:hypothetical protein